MEWHWLILAKETADSAAKSGLSQFFMDIAEGAKSGDGSNGRFGRNLALSMAKVVSDALAAWAVTLAAGIRECLKVVVLHQSRCLILTANAKLPPG
ncbi:MAG: hypothetical protein IPI79_12605 [Moraxellaceae bacterium]|nr:hypothetical protein [Moraxellaceae bacterium]